MQIKCNNQISKLENMHAENSWKDIVIFYFDLFQRPKFFLYDGAVYLYFYCAEKYDFVEKNAYLLLLLNDSTAEKDSF